MSNWSKLKHSGFKSLPAPLRVLFHPLLLVTIGLHALILFVPLRSEQKAEPPKEEKKEAVKITQLSKSSTPKTRPQVKRQLPKVNRPQLPAIAPTAPPQPATAGGGNPQADPFADFPHYSPSTPDCFGRGLGDNCRIASTDIATLTTYFNKALPDKKYQIELESDSPNLKVFRIAKEERQGFLTLLSDAPTTVYVLAEQPIKSLKDLKGAVVVPPELYQLIGDLIPGLDPNDPAETATARRENFAQPDLFFKPSADPDAVPEGRSNLDGTPSIIPGESPESLYARIDPQLRSIFEEVTPAGNFAGGTLYRLKKGPTTVYLSLVPAQIVSGAILSVWLQDPR